MGETDKILDEMFGKTLKAHPPIAPKPKPVVEKPVELHPPKKVNIPIQEIDFEYIAKSSEFQRFIYFVLTGKVHRGKLEDLQRTIQTTTTVAKDLIEIMQQEKAADYRAVMKELKQKLASKKIN